MIEDRVPAFDEMMQALVDGLKQLGAESTIQEINDKVASLLQLSTAQLSILHKPDSADKRTKFEYNLAWTRTYLKNAGYIDNVKRGKWALTEEGKAGDKLDIERIKRDVRTYKSGKNGTPVTVPSPQDEIEEDNAPDTDTANTMHTEIQWLLLKLGQDLKLDVWVANNDRSKSFVGNNFEAQPRLLRKLPPRFDEATQRTVELIDVLWLKGQAIVAAFEIENKTSIYSGLLRLSDLTAMQPDIDTPLYIVAPDERERKVILEINRPTFSKATNLAQRCRYISYSSLRDAIKRAEGLAAHLAPSFIEDFSRHVDKTENVWQ
jgi:hypothetical protein